VRVLGLSGSLRAGSHNTQLLRAAAARQPSGDELDVFEELRAIAPFDEDAEADPPAAVSRLRASVAGAGAVLIATPEYNGSLPGQLKNALDWLSRPYDRNVLRGRPVAVIGASTGLFGAVWAQADARRILGLIGADVLDVELPVGAAATAFDADGDLADPAAAQALSEAIGALTGRAPAGAC
jgi:chromate reductase